MNSKIKFVFSFVIGAAVGYVVSNKFLNDKYKKLADEEIASVKDVFSAKYSAEQAVNDVSDDQVCEEYKEQLKETKYDCCFNSNEGDHPKNEEHKKFNNRPYVIKPEEFGDKDDYDCISLTYYSDGVLTDEDNEIIEDVDCVVGSNSLKHFGEYEDDSVFVRNDIFKCDYEILTDQRKYSDVIDKDPH